MFKNTLIITSTTSVSASHHAVISRNGQIQTETHYDRYPCRSTYWGVDFFPQSLEEWNFRSISICLVGEANDYNESQWTALEKAVLMFTHSMDELHFIGSCDEVFSRKNETLTGSPGFDVYDWWSNQVWKKYKAAKFLYPIPPYLRDRINYTARIMKEYMWED